MSNLELNELARNHFQIDRLTQAQNAAVKAALAGDNVVVYLPTAAGKSLCFYLVPVAFNEVKKDPNACVVVVSPLLELMKSQAEYLCAKGSIVFFGALFWRANTQ